MCNCFWAITNQANLAIIINGKIFSKVSISRVVRQGNLLPPLIFILVMQVFDYLLTSKMEAGHWKRVCFEEEELYLGYQFYANNVMIFLEVDSNNLNNCKKEFNKFGKVLG